MKKILSQFANSLYTKHIEKPLSLSTEMHLPTPTTMEMLFSGTFYCPRARLSFYSPALSQLIPHLLLLYYIIIISHSLIYHIIPEKLKKFLPTCHVAPLGGLLAELGKELHGMR